MSTATTSDKFTSDKYTQIRGELRALLGQGAHVLIATVHPEGQATALYRLNLDSGDLQAAPLGGGATHIVADDSNLFVAGSDGHIYKAGLDAKTAKPIGPKFDPAPTAGFTTNSSLGSVATRPCRSAAPFRPGSRKWLGTVARPRAARSAR